VEYELRDIRQDRQYVRELVGQYQSRTTPTLVVGEEVLIGFDPEAVDKAIGYKS
jgi:glutaredoxin